jgi:hypothetical protein
MIKLHQAFSFGADLNPRHLPTFDEEFQIFFVHCLYKSGK